MTRLAADFRGIQISRNFNKPLVGAVVIIVTVILLPISIRAQDTSRKEAQQPPQAGAASADEEVTQLRKQVRQLTAEVGRLKAELAKLERYRTIDYTRELMLKEEQRVRELQNELIDIAAKETALQKRLDEIDEQQRPDRVERSLAGVGSVKPEEERETIYRRLANEKRNIQTQLETLRTSRTRIPALIANAEESIARLKQRLIEIRALH
jgi:peptidoglycan hydrolase CwlO-like protein